MIRVRYGHQHVYAVLLSKLCLCACAQEVKCGQIQALDQNLSIDYNEEGSGTYPVEKDCGEYKSQIWDNAFSNPNTMQLAKTVLKTVEDMGTDPVCSDTARTVINYVHVISTNTNAHYVAHMFYKLMKTLAKQATLDESGRFSKTKELILRIVDSPEILNLVTKSIVLPAEILQDPVNRVRLLKMAGSLLKIFKPSEEEKMVKNTVNTAKKAITNPFKATRGAVKKLGI